jgi:triosephosphate isomerase
MHKTSAETEELVREIIDKTAGLNDVEIVVAPPFTSLAAARKAIGSSGIGLCGQNLHWEENGAFTGEISAAMLLDAGCRWVIIGHSERRLYFGETDETVNKRLKAALSAGLKPIVCVGETLEQREAGRTEKVVSGQLEGGFSGVDGSSFPDTVIAYEPVWAIGTGKTATVEQAQEIHALIRGRLSTKYGGEKADGTRILYGGSVKPGNAGELLASPDIDGALVGGASLKADDFSAIIRASIENLEKTARHD